MHVSSNWISKYATDIFFIWDTILLKLFSKWATKIENKDKREVKRLLKVESVHTKLKKVNLLYK